MDAFVSLSILIGSIILPPLVDTILIRFKRPWIGPLLGSLSIFLLWPLIYLLPPPPPLFDPYGESQLLGALIVLGISRYIAASYLLFSLGSTVIVSIVFKMIHRRFPYKMYYFRPWATLGLVILFTGVLIILNYFNMPELLSRTIELFAFRGVALLDILIPTGIGLFTIVCISTIIAPFIIKRLPVRQSVSPTNHSTPNGP